MSWFAGYEDDIESAVESDARCDVEIADGVTIERRRVLQVSGGLAAALLLGARLPAGPGGAGAGAAAAWSGDLSFARFLETLLPLAREAVKTGEGETGYLFRAASLLSRLRDPTASPRDAMKAFKTKHVREGERFPIHVTQLRLRPGARLSHHDHRDYNGVIVGIEGEVRVRNYDVLGKQAIPPEGSTFQIRETQDTLVAPGHYSMLERRRSNVHDLRGGPEGGKVLDVFTFYGKGGGSHWMDVEEKPRDAQRRVYDAAWRTRRRRR